MTLNKNIERIVGTNDPTVTSEGRDHEKGWQEYNNKWLCVWYSELNYAAIFEGVE